MFIIGGVSWLLVEVVIFIVFVLVLGKLICFIKGMVKVFVVIMLVIEELEINLERFDVIMVVLVGLLCMCLSIEKVILMK